jgi:hypothetical protein
MEAFTGFKRPPSPTAIPLDYCLCILDLKVLFLFFAILLYPKNREKFAFTLSSPNHQGPVHQFHWAVLPQGMAQSHYVSGICCCSNRTYTL